MYLDSNKELLFAISNDSAVNILKLLSRTSGEVCFPAHWHERMEINYVLEGSMTVKIGGKETYVPAGSAAIVPPCRMHWGMAGQHGVSYRTFMFDVSAFFNACGASDKLIAPISEQNVDFLPVTDNKLITAELDGLIDEYENGKPYASMFIISGVYRLFGLLYRYCLTEKSAETVSDERFKAIIQYISEHLTDEIGSGSISREFGYDKSYFCRAFKAVTGLNPTNYINIMRLENAKKMLSETDQKVSDISGMCGFSDPNYFSRCFKKQFGISPVQYRERFSM